MIRMINAKSIEEMEAISKGDEIMRDMVKFLSEWTRKSNENGWERYLEDVRYESEKEGRQSGSKETTRNTALKMKNRGYAIEEISAITNLSKEEILALK